MGKRGNAKGGGYLFKRNNIFYLQYNVNGRRKKISLGTKNEREAKSKADELLRPVKEADTKEKIILHLAETRQLRNKDKVKIVEAWDLFIKNQNRPDSGEETLRGYRIKFHKFIDWLSNRYPLVSSLGQITEDIALDFAEHIWSSGISARTFNGYRQALSLVVKVLSKQAGITENPFEVIAKKQEDKQSRKEFSLEEVQKIFALFDDSNFYLLNKEEMAVLFKIGCWTGARLHDACMMKWGENIDLRRKTISYTPSKTKRRTNKIVTLPFIHPDLYEALEKALRWEEDGNPYVLPKVADRYMRNPSGISQDATKVFQQAGLETTVKRRGTRRQVKVCQYSFHSFRHTFVSFCAEAGIPLSIVQEIVGHGNPAMTRHYTHISKEAAKNAIKALPSAGEGNEAITVDAVDIYKEKVEKTLIILESAKKLSKREREILSILK